MMTANYNCHYSQFRVWLGWGLGSQVKCIKLSLFAYFPVHQMTKLKTTRNNKHKMTFNIHFNRIYKF